MRQRNARLIRGRPIGGAMFRSAAFALVFFALVPAAGAHVAVHVQPSRLWVLYASDWAGPMEIFAADPSGKAPVRQVTFGRPPGTCSWAAACGFTDPLPSPDGRRLAFWSAGLWFQPRTLWLAKIDGSGPREIGAATGAAWTPDSKVLVYWAADGMHELTINGVDRRVGSGTRPPAQQARGQQLLTSASSPDGRTFAFATREGIFVSAATGGSPRLAYRFGQSDLSPYPPQPFELSFSPNGRLLAATLSNALAVLDLRRKTVRIVADSAHGLAWSPDGRRLLYVQGHEPRDADSIATADVRTVTPDGHIRVIVSRSAPYGGQIVAAAWVAPPRGIVFKPPEPLDGVFAGGPVQKLAADGDRVAYASCGGVSVWNAATDATTAVQATTGGCYAPFSRSGHIGTLALAGDRVLWWSAYTGLGFTWSIYEATLGASPVAVATGSGNLGSTPNDGSGTAVGAGPLLAMSTWNIRSNVVDRQTVERVDPAGCPCTAISTSPGPYTPLDVDQQRIVVSGLNETRILAADGTILLTVPVPTLAAQLDGSQLVLASGNELRVYDAQTGALKNTLPLPARLVGHDCDLFGDPSCNYGQPLPAVTLEDVSHGLAAYVDAGQVHLLRLSDGADRVIGEGALARFADAGLAYADGARIRLTPYGLLPLQ
jgi:WD40-like Beta Propeller Repeat